MQIIHKATARAAGDNPYVFVMSDATRDRYGDIIEPAGWKLAAFKSNPVALFGHDSTLPIGAWKNVRVENGALLGELEFLNAGLSPRVDEIRAFVESRMLRAVSVGFRGLKAEPIANGGLRYTESELVECSVVSIPANPNALQVAKSLNLSRDAQRLIFGETADEITPAGRSAFGEPAVIPSSLRTKSMTTLSERIESAQTELTQLRGNLQTTIDNGGDIDTITGEIEQKDAALASLRRAEAALAGTTEQGGNQTVVTPPAPAQQRAAEPRRPFAVAARKVEPVDHIFRSMVVGLLAHARHQSHTDALKMAYGEDVSTKAVMDVLLRSATVPADTVTPAWAGALVETAVGDFFDLLLPTSIYPRLAEIGGRFGFGRAGKVSLPSRSATPTVAGSFVGEGAPIPVRQAGFVSTTITPKKMAVITTMTREITEHSTPQIEQILREAIQEDTSIALDVVLLDANAATTVRPAGIRNGASTAAGTAGGGMAALVADAKGMLTDLTTATNGNLRRPVWLMNPTQAISAGLIQDASGAFPFKVEIAAGNFMGYPALISSTVPAGVLVLVDAADFMSAVGDVPRFDVSDQTVLHMEDTAPAQIGAAGALPTGGSVRSMFQTDSLALRMIMDVSWAMRRAGTVVVRTAVTW
ncbi:prohead peptidase. Unknown type peptidase. MEROPS family U35 [Sphingomonas gellani]|uniref:Phage prohead protease, HK97 family/phage major capsid protein, HK97 family,TIGR01554 n=1 Tax=Sphingomonas gellani TaxID=1166340 RepID=A0A1H7Z6R6_9SPHN|nr:phage major capsid protein [Sphingomonas gellani]SEM53901.1 prohead peptidase. Unknown type peptidase. MEROPS family U35 [Sphingomonas gellani]